MQQFRDLGGHPGAGEGDAARGVGGGGVLFRAQRAIAVAEAGSGAQEPAGGGRPAHRDAAPHQFLQRRRGYLDVSHDGHFGHFVQAQVPAPALVLHRHLEGVAGQADARALVVDVDRMADGRGAVAPVGVTHRPTPGRTGRGRSDSRSRTPAARAPGAAKTSRHAVPRPSPFGALSRQRQRGGAAPEPINSTSVTGGRPRAAHSRRIMSSWREAALRVPRPVVGSDGDPFDRDLQQGRGDVRLVMAADPVRGCAPVFTS